MQRTHLQWYPARRRALWPCIGTSLLLRIDANMAWLPPIPSCGACPSMSYTMCHGFEVRCCLVGDSLSFISSKVGSVGLFRYHVLSQEKRPCCMLLPLKSTACHRLLSFQHYAWRNVSTRPTHCPPQASLSLPPALLHRRIGRLFLITLLHQCMTKPRSFW